MLVTLITWVYICFILISLGIVFHAITSKLLNPKSKVPASNLTVLIFNGYCLLVLICSYAYFKVNIGAYVQLAISILSLFTLFIFRQIWRNILNNLLNIIRSIKIWQWLSIALAFVSIIAAVLTHPTNIDSGNYHVQSIQWISNYHVVPGLGNLLPHLAFNQSSFLAEAFFSFSYWLNSPARVLNGFMALVLIINAIVTFDLSDSRNNKLNLVHGIMVFFFLLQYRSWLSSPTPDIIIALMVYYSIYLIIQRFINESDYNNSTILISVFWVTITAVTVKLSAAFLPLLPLLLLFKYKSEIPLKKLLVLIVSIGMLTILPWMVRNVIYSGYLIFPFPKIDLFNFDWKVPAPLAETVKDGIHAFAIDPSMQVVDVMKLSTIERISIWYNRSSFLNISLLIVIVFLQITYWGKILIKNDFTPLQKNLIVLSTLIFVNLIFWFLNAPDFRFASPFIYMSLALAIIILLPQNVINNAVFSWVILLLGFVGLIRQVEVKNLVEYPLVAEPYKQPEVNLIQVNGFEIAIPKPNNSCWNYPVPCIPYGNPSFIELRGTDLQSGFRFKYPEKRKN